MDHTIDDHLINASQAQPDLAIQRKAAVLRDACIELLKLLRSNASHTALAHQLEQLGPQLERHVNLIRKLKRFDFVEEFDALGRTVAG